MTKPQPSEDTEEPTVDWIIKELSLSSPLAQFNSQRLRELIAAHDRNLLAGIMEKLPEARYSSDFLNVPYVEASKSGKLTANGMRDGYNQALAEVTAIIKAGTPGKEK